MITDKPLKFQKDITSLYIKYIQLSTITVLVSQHSRIINQLQIFLLALYL